MGKIRWGEAVSIGLGLLWLWDWARKARAGGTPRYVRVRKLINGQIVDQVIDTTTTNLQTWLDDGWVIVT